MDNKKDEAQKLAKYQTFLAFYWLAKKGLHTVPEVSCRLIRHHHTNTNVKNTYNTYSGKEFVLSLFFLCHTFLPLLLS